MVTWIPFKVSGDHIQSFNECKLHLAWYLQPEFWDQNIVEKFRQRDRWSYNYVGYNFYILQVTESFNCYADTHFMLIPSFHRKNDIIKHTHGSIWNNCLMPHAVALGITRSVLFFSSVGEKERIGLIMWVPTNCRKLYPYSCLFLCYHMSLWKFRKVRIWVGEYAVRTDG